MLARVCQTLWGCKVDGHIWSIPVDAKRDFDYMFSDVFDELERARPAAQALEDAHLTPEQVGPLVARSRWQPIETAPKDGTQILLWIRGIEPRPRIGYWAERGCDSGWYGLQSQHAYGVIVTHWMPLPGPPHGDGGER